MDKDFKRRGIYSFLQVFSSNFILILLGIVSSFIIPANIKPEEFGYWQTYLLYGSFVGLVLFGYCDGIYLRFGGKNYDDLPKANFSALFYSMLLYLIVLFIFSFFAISFSDVDFQEKYIFYAVAISMVLRCLISFFSLINQASSRFKIYSIGNIIEKAVFVSAVVLWLFIDTISMYSLIIMSLLGQSLTFVYNIYFAKDIIKLPIDVRGLSTEIKANVLAGFPLTAYGISSMLMTGIGKFSVEHYLGKEQFGYYSFAFPIMGLVSQVVSASSLVLFPILRQVSNEDVLKFLKLSDKWSLPLFLGIMLVYFPVSFVIVRFLPDYTSTLPSLLILLPMLFFQTQITMVYNTILKVKRREREMMYISAISLLVCLLSTLTVMYLKRSLIGIAAATTFSYLVWCAILRIRVKKLVSNE